jgi:predicted dehydrogenase
VPLDLHAQVGVDVPKAQKHLLLEKPMCRTLNEAKELRQAADEAGVKAMMGLNKRWHRLMLRAREAVSSGALGKVRLINLVYSSGQDHDRVPPWRMKRNSGGGNLIENGVHCYDLWRFLLREEITEIYAIGISDGSDDEPAVICAKTERGILLNVTLSDFMPSRNEMEIFGDRQVLNISQHRFEGFEFTPKGTCSGDIVNRMKRCMQFFRELPAGILQYRYGGDYTESFRAMWIHFIQAIRNNSPVSCTLIDGQRALEITLAAVRSAETGQPVGLSTLR